MVMHPQWMDLSFYMDVLVIHLDIKQHHTVQAEDRLRVYCVQAVAFWFRGHGHEYGGVFGLTVYYSLRLE
jgi:hypothetical protein